MNQELKKEIVGALQVVQAGVSKIAEISKSDSASQAEANDAIVAVSSSISKKMAGMGVGQPHDIDANTKAFSSGFEGALRCTDHLLDLLAANSKVASSPSLGTPAGLAEPPKPATRGTNAAYMPPRC